MKSLLKDAERLQEICLSRATGEGVEDADYHELRKIFLAASSLSSLLPQFLQKCRSMAQFWEFIKHKFDNYHDRRVYLWDEFRPLIEALERGGIYPVDTTTSERLETFDSAGVRAIWSKALERRTDDPEGAITMARSLLESVCKHVLDGAKIDYPEAADLPKLYGKASRELSLAPSQHTEKVFKQILGGCTAVVEGLGALRNKLSDAHGKGKLPVRPAPRHAELAVNLAGTMASFLVATWEARTQVDA